jgi:hypothetical protein
MMTLTQRLLPKSLERKLRHWRAPDARALLPPVPLAKKARADDG